MVVDCVEQIQVKTKGNQDMVGIQECLHYLDNERKQ